MVTINPQDAKPDEVYEGTVGGKRLTLRRTPDNVYEWESFSDVHDDGEVSDLVRLVPASEVARDDLPDASVATDKYGAMKSMYFPAVDDYRDAVVAHLNANGGLPADDRWRCAHAIVEQERDQARESLRESYGLARSLNAEAHQATKRAEAAERERDEALEASALFQRDVHEWRTRAEAAEARTTPTVTREDVSDVVHGVFSTWNDNWDMIDAVCALFGVEAEPADPVTEKARELYALAHPGVFVPKGDDAELAPFRRLAAHVLGQETDHE